MIQEEDISDCVSHNPAYLRANSQSLFLITERAFCYQRMVGSLATVALRNHRSVNHTGFSLPNSISADILHSFSRVLSWLTLKHTIALTSKCFLGMYFQSLGFTSESTLDENLYLRIAILIFSSFL